MSEIIGKSKKIQFAGKDVTIRELTLGDIAKIGESISKIASRTDLFAPFKGDDDDTEKQAVAMGRLLLLLPNDLAELISMATNLDAKEVLKIPPSLIVDLLLEIWELNNLVEIFGKKLAGVLGKTGLGIPRVANPPLEPVTPPPGD